MKIMLNILFKIFLFGYEFIMILFKDFKGRVILFKCYFKWEFFDIFKVNLNLLSIFRKVVF